MSVWGRGGKACLSGGTGGRAFILSLLPENLTVGRAIFGKSIHLEGSIFPKSLPLM